MNFPKDNSFEDIWSNLRIGENFDKEGKTFFVEELFNPKLGLCYGLIPNDESFKMNFNEDFTLKIQFEEEEGASEIPPVEVNVISPVDLYSYILPEKNVVKPIVVSLEPGTVGQKN